MLILICKKISELVYVELFNKTTKHNFFTEWFSLLFVHFLFEIFKLKDLYSLCICLTDKLYLCRFLMITLDRIVSLNSRRSYTIAFKRSTIKHYELTQSKRKTADNLIISRIGLIEWVNKRDIIFDKNQKVNNRKIFNKNKIKKPMFIENEKRLFELFSSRRNDQISVT